MQNLTVLLPLYHVQYLIFAITTAWTQQFYSDIPEEALPKVRNCFVPLIRQALAYFKDNKALTELLPFHIPYSTTEGEYSAASWLHMLVGNTVTYFEELKPPTATALAWAYLPIEQAIVREIDKNAAQADEDMLHLSVDEGAQENIREAKRKLDTIELPAMEGIGQDGLCAYLTDIEEKIFTEEEREELIAIFGDKAEPDLLGDLLKSLGLLDENDEDDDRLDNLCGGSYN